MNLKHALSMVNLLAQKILLKKKKKKKTQGKVHEKVNTLVKV